MNRRSILKGMATSIPAAFMVSAISKREPVDGRTLLLARLQEECDRVRNLEPFGKRGKEYNQAAIDYAAKAIASGNNLKMLEALVYLGERGTVREVANLKHRGWTGELV